MASIKKLSILVVWMFLLLIISSVTTAGEQNTTEISKDAGGIVDGAFVQALESNFRTSGMVDIDGSILILDVDRLGSTTTEAYITEQISSSKPIIVVGSPEKIIRVLLKSTDVAAVPVANIINGTEVPIDKVVVGYVPKKIAGKVGGKMVYREYRDFNSVLDVYREIGSVVFLES